MPPTRTEATSITSSPAFFDLFVLHLAAKLVGKDTLQTNLTNSSSRLYWRSPLLVDDPSILLCPRSLDATPLFVDLTFSMAPQQVSLELGAMIVGVNSSTYIKSSPLTLEQLQEHATSVGLDLYSAPPSAMAGMVAQGLQDTLLQVVFQTTNRLELTLRYPDVSETATLTLDISRTSTIDAVATSLYYWDLSGQVLTRTTKENGNDEDAQWITEWWNKSGEGQSSTEAAKSPTGVAKPRARPAPQLHGYAKLTNKKRRNKGKIMYAKPTT